MKPSSQTLFRACVLSVALAPLFSVAAAPPPSPPQETGIITPDVATALRQFRLWNYDTNGDLVVCLPENRATGGDCRLWTLARQAVPPGRAYVGFKLSPSSALQIYWK